jgi:hypothetical protein
MPTFVEMDVATAALHGTSPITQTTGGLSPSVSDRIPVKPAERDSRG